GRLAVRQLRDAGNAHGAAGGDQGTAADGERRHRNVQKTEAGRPPDRSDRGSPDHPAGTPPGPQTEIATVPAPDEDNILPTKWGRGPKGRRGRLKMTVPREQRLKTSPRSGEARIRSNPIPAREGAPEQ